jgi:hypothetical protein
MGTFEELLKRLVIDAVREAFRQEFARPEPGGDVRYLSVREAASLAGVAPATIREWTGTGLRRYGTGRVLRIRSDERHDFMADDKHRGDQETLEHQAAEMVRVMRSQEAQRCAECRHLPSLHMTGRGCRAKNCECKAFAPQISQRGLSPSSG